MRTQLTDVFPIEHQVIQLLAVKIDLPFLYGSDLTLESLTGFELNPVKPICRRHPAQVRGIGSRAHGTAGNGLFPCAALNWQRQSYEGNCDQP